MNKTFFIFLLILFIFSFTYDNNFDFNNRKNTNYEKIKKVKLDSKIIDLTEKIKWTKINLNLDQKKIIFPFNENYELNNLWCDDSWKLKKYDKKQIIKLATIDGEEYQINDKFYALEIPKYFINDESYTIVFNSNNDGIIFDGSKIFTYDKISGKLKFILLDFYDSKNKKNIIFGETLINVLGQYLFILEKKYDNEDIRHEYCYYILHRINMKTLEDEYIDFSDYGIYQAAMGVVDGFLPIYDISLNKRYFYFYGESDKESLKYHYNNFNNFNDGLYVYDWWENRLYKVGNIRCNLVMITNNIDDGYVYIRSIKDLNAKNYEYDFYRTKNFESLLDEYK